MAAAAWNKASRELSSSSTAAAAGATPRVGGGDGVRISCRRSGVGRDTPTKTHGQRRSWNERIESNFGNHYFSVDETGQRGERMKPGMIFTVEPMINLSANYDVFIDANDKWTVFTKDNSLSAQFEHTVLVTDDGVEILTDRTGIKI